MKTVHLYGSLAQTFGGPYQMDIDSPGEAVRALESYFPGRFMRAIHDGEFILKSDGADLEEELLTFPLLGDDLHIIPVLAGSKGRGGVGKIILGAILVVAAVYTGGAALAGAQAGGTAAAGATWGSMEAFTVFGMNVTYGNIAMTGLSMMLSGISGLITPTPSLSQSSYQSRERPEDRPSHLFNGAVNTVEQGGPVPVIYGEMRTGSIVASGSITTEKI